MFQTASGIKLEKSGIKIKTLDTSVMMRSLDTGFLKEISLC
jgi:hypothetical protein